MSVVCFGSQKEPMHWNLPWVIFVPVLRFFSHSILSPLSPFGSSGFWMWSVLCTYSIISIYWTHSTFVVTKCSSLSALVVSSGFWVVSSGFYVWDLYCTIGRRQYWLIWKKSIIDWVFFLLSSSSLRPISP